MWSTHVRMWMLLYAVMDAGIGLDFVIASKAVIALNAVIVLESVILFYPAAVFWNYVWDVFVT